MRPLLAYVVAVALFLPARALADLGVPPTGPIPTTFTDLEQAFAGVRVIANWVFAFLLVIGVMALLVGAFQYLTAGEEAEKQSAARSHILYALVGIAVGTLALALVNVVTRYFGGSGLP